MSRRYPAEPARRLLSAYADQYGLGTAGLALMLRLDRRTIQRVLVRCELREDTADRIAIALGHHPCELWPTWFPKETTS